MKIFISGASAGLGSFLAKEFISQGDTVWGIGRRTAEICDQEIFSQKGFRYSQCDTAVDEQVKDTFSQMLDSGFIPDIVIFCAGSATQDITEEDFSVDRYKDNFKINLFGVLNWVELFSPLFLKRKKGIFAGISSMSIYRENHKRRIGYSASKLSLNKTFENLRLEYLNTGVRFIIFNMGRLGEKKDFIGITYFEAAALISKAIKLKNTPHTVNIPFLQYILTRMTMYIPDKVYYKYILK